MGAGNSKQDKEQFRQVPVVAEEKLIKSIEKSVETDSSRDLSNQLEQAVSKQSSAVRELNTISEKTRANANKYLQKIEKHDKGWDNPRKDIEDSIERIEKALKEHTRNTKTPEYENLKKELTACYKTNPDKTLNCAMVVEKFIEESNKIKRGNS